MTFDIFHFFIKKIKFFNGDTIECHQVLHLLLQSGRLLPGFESSHLLKILFNDGEFLSSLLDQPLNLPFHLDQLGRVVPLLLHHDEQVWHLNNKIINSADKGNKIVSTFYLLAPEVLVVDLFCYILQIH